MTAIVLSALHVRHSVLTELDNDAARTQWQQWKQDEEARSKTRSSPAVRRPPKSHEPPALILLRDHFGVILTGSLVTGTALFAVFGFLLRGALQAKHRHEGEGHQKRHIAQGRREVG